MNVNTCNKNFKKSKVLEKNADIKIVSKNSGRQLGKDRLNMRIENEMLSRFNQMERQSQAETTLSQELDFFFDNVMDTVVDYFRDEVLRT